MSDSEHNIIKEDRKVKFFSDIEGFLNEKYRKKVELLEKVVEIDKEKLEKVFLEIEKSGEPIDFIYRVIENAFKIRFFQT